MSKKNKNEDPYFKLVNITAISDLKEGLELPESDLTIQTPDSLFQFEHVEERIKGKVTLKTGVFNIVQKPSGTGFSKTELRKYDLLDSISNTHIIKSEANKFSNGLNVYKKINRPPKRSILICSPPGVGKTASINTVCRDFIEESPDSTSVIIWDTSSISAPMVNNLFQNNIRFDKNIKRLIFVIEDISGGTVEDQYGPRGTESSLLNLLDGMGNPFKDIPTFIIATTNNPEQNVAALIDRPGRFDKVLELKTPNEDESIKLLEFISQKQLSDEEIEAAKLAAKNEFSIAHLQEVVIRSMLDEISYMEVVRQFIEHKKRFANAFQDTKSIGIGF